MTEQEQAFRRALEAVILAAVAAPFRAQGYGMQRSFDEAERMIDAANAIIEARERAEGKAT